MPGGLIGPHRAALYRRRLIVVPSGPGAIFGQDNFNDGTDGTEIIARSASDGGTWTEHTNYSGGAIWIGNAGRVRSGGTAVDYHSGTPASADYDVSADLIMHTDNNSGLAAVAGRINTAADTYYYAGYATSGNVWFINKVVAGSITTLDTAAATLTVSQVYAIKLEMRSTALKLYVDAVETCSGTDGDISAAGKAGLRMQGLNTNVAGMNLDNYLAQDAA